MDIANLKTEAEAKVQAENPGSTKIRSGDAYGNFLGGTLIDVTFQNIDGKDSINHVHFAEEVKVYRVFHDVCEAVASYKERRLFFRFLEFAGIGGLIALILIVVFSFLLSVLAIWGKDTNSSTIEIVKMSFTLILGYFFGSQSRKTD